MVWFGVWHERGRSETAAEALSRHRSSMPLRIGGLDRRFT